MAMLNNQMVLLTMSENPNNDHLLPLELGMCNMGYLRWFLILFHIEISKNGIYCKYM